jgi:hypothetical protein
MSNQTSQQKANVNQKQPSSQKKPNERGSFEVQAHFKVFDPQTKQVYVEGRA